MTYEMIIEMLTALELDVYFYETSRDGFLTIRADYCDFEGFDKNWREIFREFDNPQAVKEFQDTLKTQAIFVIPDFYQTYVFDGFQVITGYTSYDI